MIREILDEAIEYGSNIEQSKQLVNDLIVNYITHQIQKVKSLELMEHIENEGL